MEILLPFQQKIEMESPTQKESPDERFETLAIKLWTSDLRHKIDLRHK